MKENPKDKTENSSIPVCIETFEFEDGDPTAAPDRRCYTVEDLQIILSCGRQAVYSLLRRKEFNTFKVGGCYRISKSSFDAWLEARL